MKRERTDWLLRWNLKVPGETVIVVWVGHEARVGAAVHLLARVIKGRLSGGVVLRLEDEVDHVAGGGLDGLGVVEEHWRGSAGCVGWRSDTANSDLYFIPD